MGASRSLLALAAALAILAATASALGTDPSTADLAMSAPGEPAILVGDGDSPPPPPTEFVWPCGTRFCTGPASNPVPLRFAGTNAFYLLLDYLTEADIRATMAASASRGANLLRFFAFTNGFGAGSVTMAAPIQPSPGVFDEAALRRLDFILSEAGKAGLRVIMPLANFEDEMGGMAWYVDNVVGPGNPKELFYTHPAVKDAYWTYVSTVLGRTNTITGVRYVDDPTIFSIELANEPHTTNRFEADRGLPPGKLVRDWVWEMAGRIKGYPGFKGMVSTGEEGYRADGEAKSAHNAWINGGFKGVDFVGNSHCPNVSFATVHVYPDNWEVPSSDYAWVGPNYLADRAAIAHAAGKPIIVEEYGMKAGYGPGRDELYAYMHSQAEAVGAGATLAWAAYAWPVNEGDGSYNFAWGGPGTAALEAEFGRVGRANAAAARASAAAGAAAAPAAVHSASAPAPSHASTLPTCFDVHPPSGGSCADQKRWGKCGAAWLTAGGFCRASCRRCGGDGVGGAAAALPPAPHHLLPCVDVLPPGSTATCSQQKAWGKCQAGWMVANGWCRATCDRTCSGGGGGGGGVSGGGGATAAGALHPPASLGGPCVDVQPASGGNCAAQKAWGKCGAAWMTANGWCAATCGRCGGSGGVAHGGHRRTGAAAAPAPQPSGSVHTRAHRPAPAPALAEHKGAPAAAPAPAPAAAAHAPAAAPAHATKAPAPALQPHRGEGDHHPAPAAPALAAPPAPAGGRAGGAKSALVSFTPAAGGGHPVATATKTATATTTTTTTTMTTTATRQGGAMPDDGTADVPGSSSQTEAALEATATSVMAKVGAVGDGAVSAVTAPDDAPRSHPDAPLPGEVVGDVQ